jgi:hypothetical protein
MCVVFSKKLNFFLRQKHTVSIFLVSHSLSSVCLSLRILFVKPELTLKWCLLFHISSRPCDPLSHGTCSPTCTVALRPDQTRSFVAIVLSVIKTRLLTLSTLRLYICFPRCGYFGPSIDYTTPTLQGVAIVSKLGDGPKEPGDWGPK